MSLRDVKIKPTYRSGSSNLIREFYIPCLKNSIKYDRAVGFFNSSIFEYLGEGLYPFIVNGGSIRLITGVELSENDINLIKQGYEYKEIIEKNLGEKIEEIIDKKDLASISNISWLIKNGKLDMKICIRDLQSDIAFMDAYNLNNISINSMYHEKFGILTDIIGNRVAFTGSTNESINGWLFNFESIETYCSWNGHEKVRIDEREKYFEYLWNNNTPGAKVFEIPEAIKDNLIKIAPNEPVYQDIHINDNEGVLRSILGLESGLIYNVKKEEIKPREYQLKALEAWKDNDYKGFFEMATGTGKTITALLCAREFLKTHKSTIVVIVCPYQHLVDQWQNELSRFGYYSVCCYQNKESWYNRVIEKIRDVNLGIVDNAFIITTSTTASMDAFQEVIKRIRRDVLLVADEAHNLGAEKRQIILNKTFKGRIGLSATPQRWFDELGTDKLYKYFDKVIFRYDMKEAIENGVLTKYEYNPIFIELNEEEYKKYEELSQKINKLLLSGVPEDDEGLNLLLIKRANIINNAKDKLKKFKELIKKDGNLKYTLVYTSPGQIEEVQNILNEDNIFYQRFTSRESNNERRRILDQFKRGDVNILVAMHCLDEGVDVPATKKAYILASSANPKEFIQRRGRVLRKSPGKEKAIIYDFIAIPPAGADISSATQSIVRKELKRFKEFADLAINEFSAKLKISEIAKKYNLLDEV